MHILQLLKPQQNPLGSGVFPPLYTPLSKPCEDRGPNDTGQEAGGQRLLSFHGWHKVAALPAPVALASMET